MRIVFVLMTFVFGAHGETVVALQQATADCAPTKEALAEVTRLRAAVDAVAKDESATDAAFGAATDRLVAAMIRTGTVMLKKHQGIKILERSGGVQKVQVSSATVFRVGYPAFESSGIRV